MFANGARKVVKDLNLTLADLQPLCEELVRKEAAVVSLKTYCYWRQKHFVTHHVCALETETQEQQKKMSALN